VQLQNGSELALLHTTLALFYTTVGNEPDPHSWKGFLRFVMGSSLFHMTSRLDSDIIDQVYAVVRQGVDLWYLISLLTLIL
jgi:hypothetical protein